MGQKNNVVMRLMLAFLCAAVMMWNVGITARAGFGDYNDYDYDSGWDSDWDSDWGYDSSWDSDWDSDWSSSGSYSSGGGYYYGNLSGGVDFGAVAFVIFAIIIISVYKSKHTGRSNSPSRPRPSVQSGQGTRQARKQITPLKDRTDEITVIMKKTDVNFSANDFITYAKKVYIDIQDAWCKRDLEPVRAVLHPNLYEQTQKQIQKKIDAKIINYLERITVNTAYMSGFRRDDDYEYLTVYLTSQMIDYQVHEETGQILYGDKTTRWDMQYKMIFVRAAGMETPDAAAEENNDVMRCPSCGAPVEGTAFGQCQYCGSTVSSGKYGWVLTDFAAMREDTKDEGIQVPVDTDN